MKNIKKIIFPLFIFLVFVVLVIYDDIFINAETVKELKLLTNVLYYLVHIGLLISGAHLLNVLIRIFF